MTLTDEPLAEIRGRLEAATSGPWKWSPKLPSEVFIPDTPNAARGHALGTTHSNAEFIAHAPTDIRALLDEVNRLREFILEFEDDYTAALNDHGEELSGLLRKLEKETGSLP